MESPSSELAVFDLIRGTRALQRRWKAILAAAVLAAVAGVAAASAVAPVWESEVNIQVGSAFNQLLEEPRLLARILESAAFRSSIPVQFSYPGAQPVRVEVIEGAGPGVVAYLRVITRGRTAEQAAALASFVLDSVKTRHLQLYDTVTRDQSEWEKTLIRLGTELDASIGQLQASLARVGVDQRDNLAVILQVQLESKQARALMIARELKDARLQLASNTRPTKEIGPPSVPTEPIWPRRTAFAVVGGALGLIVASAAALLVG